eukprot:gene10263-biopygen10812
MLEMLISAFPALNMHGRQHSRLPQCCLNAENAEIAGICIPGIPTAPVNAGNTEHAEISIYGIETASLHAGNAGISIPGITTANSQECTPGMLKMPKLPTSAFLASLCVPTQTC